MILAPGAHVFYLYGRGLVREVRPVLRPHSPTDLRAQLLLRWARAVDQRAAQT